MNDKSAPEANASRGIERTTIDDLTESAIRRRLFADALQHPATLLPATVSAMSVIWLLVLSPVFYGRLWAIVLLAVSGTVAIGSFVWQYVFRHAEEYTERARELMDHQDRELARLDQEKIRQLREALQGEFASIDSAEGLKALNGLIDEYEQLQAALRRQRDTDPFSMSYLPALSEEAYRRGLSVLSDAVELMSVARTTGRERIERELAELENEIEASKVDENQAERLKIKSDTRAAYQHRLDMLDQLGLRVDQLLYQVSRCEASLHQTHIELASIRTGSSETSLDSVIEALQGTINQVKEVQKELKQLGY